MIQTYQGYFQEDGRFISDCIIVQMPVRRMTIINVLDEEINDGTIATSKKQKEALIRLYTGLKTIEDEPLDDEFEAIISEGFNIKKELDL